MATPPIFLTSPTPPVRTEYPDVASLIQAAAAMRAQMQQQELQEQKFAFDKEETAKQAARQAEEGKRAQGYLDLQRAMYERNLQNDRASQEAASKKQREALISELEEAQRIGSQDRIQAALQALKRLGGTKEVRLGETPPAPNPWLSQLPGIPSPPGAKGDPELEFTGEELDSFDEGALGKIPTATGGSEISTDDLSKLTPEQRAEFGLDEDPPGVKVIENATPEQIAAPKSKMGASGAASGLVEPGNIRGIFDRKELQNPDGTVSTTSSISFEENGREVLIPTVVDGRRLSEDQAIARYRATGEHLGKFDSVESANRFAQQLHERQASTGAQSQPSRGRLELRDEKTGQSLYTEPEGRFGANATAIQGMMQPLIDGAPDYGRAAAEKATRFAEVQVNSDVPLAEARDKAIDLYKFEMAEIEKTRRTAMNQKRAGVGGPAPSKVYENDPRSDRQRAADDLMTTRLHDKLSQNLKIPSLQESLQTLDRVEGAIATDTGVGQFAAVTNIVKSMQGRPSDADMRQMFGSGGAWSQLSSFINKYADPQGRLDPKYIGQVKQLTAAAKAEIQNKLGAASAELKRRILANENISPIGRKIGVDVYGDAYGGTSPDEGKSTDELLESAP